LHVPFDAALFFFPTFLLFLFAELGRAIHTWDWVLFISFSIPALYFVVGSLICICGICLQSLELWNMNENKTMTLPAHEGLIAALAVSTATGLVASASHDKFVKLWK